MAVSPPQETPEEQKCDLHCAEFVKILLVCHFKINVEGKTGSGVFFLFFFIVFPQKTCVAIVENNKTIMVRI